jgi:uncharacterized protein (DUF302 family)
MKTVNFKTEVSGQVEDVAKQVTEVLKTEGFGVLTRIDLHTKIKEKLGKDPPPAVILGTCNPELAYEAYQTNTDVTSLLPCNVVVREVAPQRVSLEIAKPTVLMEILEDERLTQLANEADQRLERVLKTFAAKAA